AWRAAGVARRAGLRQSAAGLADLGADPGRVADRYLAADEPALAVPYVLTAARTALATGLPEQALRWIEAVGDTPELAALKADALAATGDDAAVPAYRQAFAVAGPDQAPGLRARLGPAALLARRLAAGPDGPARPPAAR